MNRNILCFCIGVVFFLTCPAMAQISGTASTKAASAKAKKIEVKDYKSFKKYVADEETNLKSQPLTTDNALAKEKLKTMGINFEEGRPVIESEDGNMSAYISSDKKGVAVVEARKKTISLFNAEGMLLKKVQMKKQLEGFIGFSQNRIFEFRGNFEDRAGSIAIYDFSGELIKQITDSGIMEAFMVSPSQKLFAVASMDWDKDKDYFILYDGDGKEIWRKEVMTGSRPIIAFSRDDNYVILKLPNYWKDKRSNKSRGSKWVYVFRVSDGEVISGENYAD